MPAPRCPKAVYAPANGAADTGAECWDCPCGSCNSCGEAEASDTRCTDWRTFSGPAVSPVRPLAPPLSSGPSPTGIYKQGQHETWTEQRPVRDEHSLNTCVRRVNPAHEFT